ECAMCKNLVSVMEKIAFLILFVIFNISAINGARILGIALVPSFSHQVTYRPLWKELSLRGHQLLVLTTDPMNDPSLTNLTEVDLSFSYEMWDRDVVPVMNNPKSAEHVMEVLTVTMKKIVNQQLSYTEIQKLIRNENECFDLVIAEISAPITVIFSERFKCPYIGIMSNDPPTIVYNLIGNPVNPIANPDVNLPYSGKLSFYERFSSVVHNLIMDYVLTDYFKFMDENVKSHFGEGFLSVPDVISKMSLLFVNTNSILNQMRPLMPNVIQIGDGIHRHSSKPLPRDLQEHLDNATQGAIYFSLGSNVKSKLLSNKTKIVLLETFSELPYTVLWKFEHDDLPCKYDNVITSEWFPQQDIFKHPNVKLFITQGGIQSIDEAIYDHIPILGLPFFMDQITNVQRLVHKGLGLSLDYKTLDKKILKATILEIINNPKYRNRVKELADLVSDQPMTGLEKAVWWTEYVIRHKGAKHLRSSILEIPSYQYYLLDVIGFCLGIVPTPSYSHQVVFHPIWEKLSLKGHDLVVLTTNPIKNSSLTTLKEIDLSFAYELWNVKHNITNIIEMAQESLLKYIDRYVAMVDDIIEQELQHPDVQNIIKNETEHFDLLMLEYPYPVMTAFSERFKCPFIGMTSLDAHAIVYDAVGNPSHPVLNPDFSLPLGASLTFKERLLSVLFQLYIKYYVYWISNPKGDLTVQKYFGENYSSLKELATKVDMLFVNVDPIFHSIRPIVPAVIQIGGGTHIRPARKLPNDIQTFLDNSPEGVVYVSLGSNVKSASLSEKTRKVLLETFSDIPYKVLWKYEADSLLQKPNNVFISKWYPQQDIFRHLNVKLFITQGGLQSMEEAIYNYVPLIGIPFFGDQFINVAIMVSRGFDQPMTGLERAIWWTEYVIRHKGAKHLRSPAIDLPLYQYFLLDVIAFLLAARETGLMHAGSKSKRFEETIMLRFAITICTLLLFKWCAAQQCSYYAIRQATIKCSNSTSIEEINVKVDEILHENNVTISDIKELHLIKCKIVNPVFNNLNVAPHLKVIWISDSDIKKLPSGIFNNLPKVKKIRLIDNNIEEIENNAFEGCKELNYLFLQGNKIKTLPDKLGDEIALQYFDLSRNEIDSIKPKWFRGLTNVTTLYLRRNKLQGLYEGSFRELSNLTSLHVRDNNLAVIENGAFEGLISLKILFLSRNQLVSLGDKCFHDISNLGYLDLEENKIEDLPSTVFKGLYSLTELSLKKNLITKIDSQLFQGLFSLEQLFLTDNKINILEDNCFKDLNKLTFLVLANNSLTIITPSTFAGLVNLQNLYLSNNQIKHLQAEAFSNNTQLTNLFLEENNLIQIEPNTFRTANKLLRIHLSKNKINKLEKNSLNGLEALNYLLLNDNQIETLSTDTFEHLHNLQSLEIRNNTIEYLSSGIFSKLENLQFLYLSGNQITNLPDDIFRPLQKLYILALDHNHIEHVSRKLFSNLTYLVDIRLSHNQISVIEPRSFELTHERLAVYLDNNRLNAVDSEMFAGSKIRSLNLSYNQISELSLDDFEPVKYLLSMNLKGNPLPSDVLRQFEEKYKESNYYDFIASLSL
ncbi:hypothetical protein ILUMI_12612, partial [Ignelater luminosus]